MEATEARIAKAEARMDKMDQKWDQRFEATRRLIENGIKFIQSRDEKRDANLAARDTQRNAQFAALVQTVGKLAKTQQALLDSLRLGGNGNGRRRG